MIQIPFIEMNLYNLMRFIDKYYVYNINKNNKQVRKIL